ncbi:hypothetical protein KXQ82_17820 [Mucilaginibacter sp. HMF5004]|uniref:hypothetical protein n=1 Tax=Mucilaginibacter rivuli TaxID=2857527 RepID=UPI001C5E9A22|nr:hypothetical protein [Mucilaginibacter rivuli]MBW4891589.1 hypothetical protein [Mucilaginibacter rivuli]
MENKTNKVSGREKVLTYFKNGQIPTEKHYSDLINSMIHKEDDGFSKDDLNGFKIYSDDKYNKLVSFYQDSDATNPFFTISKDKPTPDSLKMQSFEQSKLDNADDVGVFFHANGNLGIGKKAEEQYKADVDGFVAMKGRIGTYPTKVSSVNADGKWYTIIDGLQNAQAFEIMARTGKKATGKLAIMHAIALSIAGKRGGKIHRRNAYFGFFWNKINLRWVGDFKGYSLQIKTNSHYGDGVKIYFTVAQLWDDKLFLSEDYYYTDNPHK